MPFVRDVVEFLEAFAPPHLAEKWDNVGLLVGNRQEPVSRILTCLTLTPDVADEAIQRGAELIVSHHPVLFRPIQKLTTDDAQGRMLLRLIEARVAVYSPHTCYDSAAAGINQQLAELLGLSDIEPIRPATRPGEYAIVVYVPTANREAVQQAMWKAGAGKIGEYSKCSFFHPGTGTFEGSDASNPTIGCAGSFEQVDEQRLELKVTRSRLRDVLAAMQASHPYEEPAYFIHPLDPSPIASQSRADGTGRMGSLAGPAGASGPVPIANFLTLVKQKLSVQNLGYNGDLERPAHKVAIACGAGAELLSDAAARGCDLFLTGEARFHSMLEARDLGVAIVVCGHYATERPAVENLARILANKFPELQAEASQQETDPLKWF